MKPLVLSVLALAFSLTAGAGLAAETQENGVVGMAAAPFLNDGMAAGVTAELQCEYGPRRSGGGWGPQGGRYPGSGRHSHYPGRGPARPGGGRHGHVPRW